MSATRAPNAITAAAIDSAPLLVPRSGGGDEQSRRSSPRPSLSAAARFLRRASSRRLLREPSMLVREAATEQLEERQSDWANSRPVVFLDILWNLAFVGVAAVILIMSTKEKPTMPLRVWIVGYALQCDLHVLCVCLEYRRRHPQGQADLGLEDDGTGNQEGRSQGSSGPSSPRDLEEGGAVGTNYNHEQSQTEDENHSIAKLLESANTMFSFIWWIIGFYWVSAGGQALTRESPQLYWLCIVFLAFDVFFVVFCVAVACIIGIAVCCCLPCIIAILYAVADQEGASEDDIHRLPKFKFQRAVDVEKKNEIQRSCGGIMSECGNPQNEVHLSSENAKLALFGAMQECCICLSAYEDGVELATTSLRPPFPLRLRRQVAAHQCHLPSLQV
ncbi:E3 ubiquitin-protein ligase [Platanthera guangdongensis]|uniref:RING-type E3 ubiquitin transferase n=1 Tax=Platanthera guangdongensis TaxID=2320717 RepID=A0ABR2M2Z6_9ASPA